MSVQRLAYLLVVVPFMVERAGRWGIVVVLFVV